MAAFAHEPPDAASACIAVIDSREDPSVTIPRYRQLGAPVFFVLHGQKLQWWSQGVVRPQLLQTLEPTETPRFFAEHQDELAPERIYRAKTRGRFEGGYQLDFVDIGLMPLVEEEMGKRLSALVEQAVVRARKNLPRKLTSPLGNWLFRSVFWLLAAKILRDKNVSGFEDLKLTEIEPVFSKVSKHYGSHDREFALRAKNRRLALESAAEIFHSFSSLAHITTESLASVYENTLVSKETRTALGTHSTPAFLARYVVGRLAPWIGEMEPEKRNVFEPTCGHGSFLVAAMRLLRDGLPEDIVPDKRRAYLRERLHGVDIDPFAIELARLSLTLADIPNADGWDLRCADVFTDTQLTRSAGEATILLANPPFESFNEREREYLISRGIDIKPGYKATEICRRILPHLRPGAVFGIVLPRGFISTKSANDVRSLLVHSFELAEITLLPDKVFTHSDAESVLLFGRRRHPGDARGNVHYVRVREPDASRFRTSHEVSVTRVLTQERFSSAHDNCFFVPELEEIWCVCKGLPTLQEIVKIGKGLEHKSPSGRGKNRLRENREVISARRFEGAVRGFARLETDLMIHQLPRTKWISLNAEDIRRKGLGFYTGIPQVLVNHSPVSRDPWRLKAFIDSQGHAVRGRFLILRPRHKEISLAYIWALLVSPLANAFFYTYSTKRDILKKTLKCLPIPKESDSATIEGVTMAVQRYFDVVGKEFDNVMKPHLDPSRARDLLLAVDAAVLRLYDLPPALEYQILDLFSGFRRLGVPFDLDCYLPGVVKVGDLSISPSVVAQFWNAFEDRINRGARIFALNEPVAPDSLRNALRQPLAYTGNIGQAYFFFVDQVPEANWAHNCAYAFVKHDGTTAWCDARWPPDEGWNLELVARL